MLLPMWQVDLDCPVALAKSFLISQRQEGTIVPEEPIACSQQMLVESILLGREKGAINWARPGG
jgi:hypothetical protein